MHVVWRSNFGTGLEGTVENGLQEDTVHDTKLVFRHKQNLLDSPQKIYHVQVQHSSL